MSDDTRSLWPENLFDEATKLRPPILLLEEQAEELATISKGMIAGRVESWAHKAKFYHRLLFVAPFLDNYSYELLTIRHDITLYPVEVIPNSDDDPHMSADDEDELGYALSNIFKSRRTVRIMQAIIAQSISKTKLPTDPDDDLPF